MPARKGLLAPQNTFLDTIATRFDGTHSNFVLGNAKITRLYPVVYCSDGFCELTGYSRAQVMQKSCACKFLHGPKTEGQLAARIAAALEDKQELKLELVLYRRSGTPFWCLLDICGIQNESHEVVLFLCAFKDITKEKFHAQQRQLHAAAAHEQPDDSDKSHSSAPQQAAESHQQVAAAAAESASVQRAAGDELARVNFRDDERSSAAPADELADERALISMDEFGIEEGDESDQDHDKQTTNQYSRRRSRAVLYQLSGHYGGPRSVSMKSKLKLNNRMTIPEYKTTTIAKERLILSHYGLPKACWDWLILIVTFYVAIVVPYNAAFKDRQHKSSDDCEMDWGDIIVELVFVIDVILNFRTTFVNRKGEVVTKPSTICRHYFKGWFAVDACAALPFDLLCSLNIYKRSRLDLNLLKLIRLLRLARLLQKMDRYSQYSYIILTLLMLIFSLLAHWCACIWYVIAMEEIRENPPEWRIGWIHQLSDKLGYNVVNSTSMSSSYITALYFTTSSLTSVGFGNVSANTNAEKIFSIVIMLIGALMHAVVFGNVTALIRVMYARRSNYQTRLRDLKDLFRLHQIPKELQQRMSDYFQTTWSLNHGIEIAEILRDFPEELRGDVSLHLHREVLTLPIFATAPQGFLKSLARHIESKFCCPTEYLIHRGDALGYLYLVCNGSMEVLQDNMVVGILGKGDLVGYDVAAASTPEHTQFGLSKVSVGLVKSSSDLKALTYCDLKCIHIGGLLEVLKLYPEFSDTFHEEILHDLSFNLREVHEGDELPAYARGLPDDHRGDDEPSNADTGDDSDDQGDDRRPLYTMDQRRASAGGCAPPTRESSATIGRYDHDDERAAELPEEDEQEDEEESDADVDEEEDDGDDEAGGHDNGPFGGGGGGPGGASSGGGGASWLGPNNGPDSSSQPEPPSSSKSGDGDDSAHADRPTNGSGGSRRQQRMRGRLVTLHNSLQDCDPQSSSLCESPSSTRALKSAGSSLSEDELAVLGSSSISQRQSAGVSRVLRAHWQHSHSYDELAAGDGLRRDRRQSRSNQVIGSATSGGAKPFVIDHASRLAENRSADTLIDCGPAGGRRNSIAHGKATLLAGRQAAPHGPLSCAPVMLRTALKSSVQSSPSLASSGAAKKPALAFDLSRNTTAIVDRRRRSAGCIAARSAAAVSTDGTSAQAAPAASKRSQLNRHSSPTHINENSAARPLRVAPPAARSARYLVLRATGQPSRHAAPAATMAAGTSGRSANRSEELKVIEGRMADICASVSEMRQDMSEFRASVRLLMQMLADGRKIASPSEHLHSGATPSDARRLTDAGQQMTAGGGPATDAALDSTCRRRCKQQQAPLPTTTREPAPADARTRLPASAEFAGGRARGGPAGACRLISRLAFARSGSTLSLPGSGPTSSQQREARARRPLHKLRPPPEDSAEAAADIWAPREASRVRDLGAPAQQLRPTSQCSAGSSSIAAGGLGGNLVMNSDNDSGRSSSSINSSSVTLTTNPLLELDAGGARSWPPAEARAKMLVTSAAEGRAHCYAIDLGAAESATDARYSRD